MGEIDDSCSHMETSHSSKPSAQWYAFWLSLWLLGTCAAAVLGWSVFTKVRDEINDKDHVHQFLLPGSVTLQVSKPGNYTFWNEFRTTFRGTVFRSSEDLNNGLKLQLRSKADGALLPLTDSLGARVQIGSRERVSMFVIAIPQAGEYEVVGEGAFQQRVFSLRPSVPIRKYVMLFFKGVTAVGLLVVAWGFVPIAAFVLYTSRKSYETAQRGMSESLSPEVERHRCMMAHLTALSGLVLPFGNLLGPTIVYGIYGGRSERVAAHAKESINFQATMLVLMLLSIPLLFVIVGIFLLMVVGLLSWILAIIAGIKANEGIEFRYPCTYRFLQ